MEERSGSGNIADYFVVAGLPDNPEPVDDDYCEGLNPNEQNIEPITDITVIFPGAGEKVPQGFHCVTHTPSGHAADLNCGSLRAPEIYLCYRRGRDRPPLVDIGVMYEEKERLLSDSEVVKTSPEGRPANVNNTRDKTFLTYRRAPENMPMNALVVTDICVIFQNKGERPPHAFCMLLKNLNKGIMGCSVFLCYKKSMNRPPLLSYKAEVLLRYPPVDRPGFPFPSSVAMFCLPMCATIESWPICAAQPRDVFSTFVLTVADATEKIYGAAVTFYEKHPEEKLTEEQKAALGIDVPGDKIAKSVHVNKCICLLSHYPFFDSFKTYLFYLYNMCRDVEHEVPIERYISHLMEEVPFPSPSRPNIFLQLSPIHNVLISHPHDSPLPKSGASFREMLMTLGSENCLLVLLLILTEQKILIHSLRPDVLTTVVEAIALIIFPFVWQCPYIPLCPLQLCAVLQAPVPFLIGVDSRFFDLYELPQDVTCIDLDTSTVTVSEDKRSVLNVKLLAKKPARTLKHTLEILQDKVNYLSRANLSKSRADPHNSMELNFQLKRRERMLELEIQEAFLRFMTSVLKGYRSYLIPITKSRSVGATDASSLFDLKGFLNSRDKNYQKFYQLMCPTQMFIRFIEERSFVSDNDTGLAFFDECIDKDCQDNSDTLRLLDLNESTQSDRTVFVMPPEATGLPPNQRYSYNSVFKLNESLFGNQKLKSGSLDRVQRNDISAPGSPVARRTKQEIKSAQKNAKLYSETPMQWAKYLMSTCYSLWFIHLPSYLTVASSKHMALCLAYEMLIRMAKNRIQPADEVCYRVVMQLCGLYSQPVIAVKVLFEMKRWGITPNAITYGFYNKAVLEAQWPSNVSNSSQLMWNKLRNVIIGAAKFRAAGRQCQRRLSQSIDDVDHISTGSGASTSSQTKQTQLLSQKVTSTTLTPTNNSNITNNLTQGDSSTQNMPARISSSSDIGYGSMHEQKVTDTETEPDEENTASNNNNDNNTSVVGNGKSSGGSGRFWGKMGQSLDQWVKTGVNSTLESLATVASLASDTSYYSPGGLIMSGYKGDYLSRDEDDDEYSDGDEYDIQQHQQQQQKKMAVHRCLDFGDDQKQNEQKIDTLKLIRSVSFGNDTQIMSKLKELKQDLVKGNGNIFNTTSTPNTSSSSRNPANKVMPTTSVSSSQIETGKLLSSNKTRNGSEESDGSLETKVNQFYEGNSREASIEKSQSSPSREVTPVKEEHEEELLQSGTVLPPVPKSPSIQIKYRENLTSKDVSPCSPARTPVTQNDPLGALSHPPSPQRNNSKSTPPLKNSSHALSSSQSNIRDSPKRACSEGHIMAPHMSGGNHNGGKDLSGTGFASKSFHRSSTLPNYSCLINAGGNGSPTPNEEKNLVSYSGLGGGSTTNVVSSLTAISSSLKNPFGRYSPARLSLRKAGTSLIESTIGGKKAEALMEGFNQFKSVAAVTAKKKLDEFKEAIGNNNYPPGRTGPFGGDDYRDSGDLLDWENPEQAASNQWASVSDSYLDQLFTADGSTRASFSTAEIGPSHDDTPLSSSTQSLLLPESGKGVSANSKKDRQPIAINISMTTCSVCHSCSSLLFDEEIMAGWSAEDSNLNTRCPHCKKWEVPFLEVIIKDYRHYPMPLFNPAPLTSAPSLDSVNSIPSHYRRTSINPNLVTNSSSQQNTANNKEAATEANETKDTCNKLGVPNHSKSFKSSEIDALLNTSGMESVSNCVNGESPCLDPLGVLEERSRRSSPEPEEIPNNTTNCNLTLGQTSLLTVPGEEDKMSQKSVPIEILNGVNAEPVIVPYLSPLVLRKELENVLEQEGDSCLVQCRFVDEHPIIYWNLVWFFHRANLTSHLKGLTLLAKSIKPNVPVKKYNTESGELIEGEQEPFAVHSSWDSSDHRNVKIECLWDNPKFYAQFGTPLYVQWQKNQKDREVNKTESDISNETNTKTNKLMQDIVKSVARNELSQICPRLLFFHWKEGKGGRHYPVYRDILFLALTAGGKESLDSYGYGFDREYRDVYSRLRNSEEQEQFEVGDMPPSDSAIFCRRFFRELQLQLS